MSAGKLAWLVLIALMLVACDSGTPGPPEAIAPPEGSPGEPGAEQQPGQETEVDQVVQAPTEVVPEEVSVPDYQIVTRIRSRYLVDTSVRSSVPTIRVSSADGIVTLAGEAETGLARVRATAIARGTYGVRSVVAQLGGPDPTPEETAEGDSVPPEVMAHEPRFAEGVRNYATNDIVEPIAVVRRPDAPAPAPEPVPDPAQAIADPVAEPVADPTPDPPAPAAAPTPVQAGGTYTVQDGDRLWNIAQETMGSGNRWEELFEANREVMQDDPNRLFPGMELVIPQ